MQVLFATLSLWIGVQFYLWVRWAEGVGRAFEVSRPAGVEGWLPIEGLMQFEVLSNHRESATCACGRFLPLNLVPRDFIRLPQGVLQLDMSDGYRLGISVESWPLNLWSELPVPTLG